MDVSVRHWPIFATGLLLGAAGTMSLGLHRPTQAELAAFSLAAATSPVAAVTSVPAASAAAAPAGPDSVGDAEERMRSAAQAFRLQEARAAADAPDALAVVVPPKHRARKMVKEQAAEAAIAVAPGSAEPAAARSATSVMGAPAPVQAARGSANAANAAEIGSLD